MERNENGKKSREERGGIRVVQQELWIRIEKKSFNNPYGESVFSFKAIGKESLSLTRRKVTTSPRGKRDETAQDKRTNEQNPIPRR